MSGPFITLGRRSLDLLPAAGALGLGAVSWHGLRREISDLASTLIGARISELTLSALPDRSSVLSTADLRDQVSLLNFWASWCAPCRLEMPWLMKLAQSGEVAVFGVKYKDRPVSAEAFLAQADDPLQKIGTDSSGRMAIDWGAYGLTETFLIDTKGRIAFKQVMPLDDSMLAATILPMVLKVNAEGGA